MNRQDRQLRANYRAVIEAFEVAGAFDEAMACAQLAVNQGLWKHPLQRPVDYDPDLPAKPFYDPANFEHAAVLSAQHETVAAEVKAMLAGASEFHTFTEGVVRAGRMRQTLLSQDGYRFAEAAKAFPVTTKVLDQLAGDAHATGEIYLLCFDPGTRVVPDPAETNRRLRLHLAIQAGEGAHLKIGENQRAWSSAACLVFDESFQHEIHAGDHQALILLTLDVPHPDGRQVISHEKADGGLKQNLRKFLQSRGLGGLRREDGALVLLPDSVTDKTIRRYMEDSRFHAVERKQGRLVFETSDTQDEEILEPVSSDPPSGGFSGGFIP